MPSLILRLALAAALAACATACGPGIKGGPTMDSKVNPEPGPSGGPDRASDAILARDAQTNVAQVKHVLIGWKDDSRPDQDPRAAGRTRAQADTLALSILERVRAGEPVEALMQQYSEDPGSAASGVSYEATPDAGLVFPFKRLALRLKVGEAGLVESELGWHVMKRIE
jgi:hypothetical protein